MGHIMIFEDQQVKNLAKELLEEEKEHIILVLKEIISGLKSCDPKLKVNSAKSLQWSLGSLPIYDSTGSAVLSKGTILEKFIKYPNISQNVIDDLIKTIHKVYKDMVLEFAFGVIIESLNDELIDNDMLYCIRFLDDPRAVDHLLSFLKESSSENRLLLDLFIQFKGESTEPLLKLKDSGNKFVRRYVAAYIGEIRATDSSDVLIKFLDDIDCNVRFKAIVALGQLGDEKFIEPIMGLINDNSVNVRRKAVEVLGILSSGERIYTREELIRKNQKAEINYQIKDNVQINKNNESLITALSKPLKDDSVPVRKATLDSLLKIGTSEALKCLEEIKDDENPEIRSLVHDSLKKYDFDDKIIVTPWNETFADLDAANHNQKKFYGYWLSELNKGNFIDLYSNLSYIFAFLYSVIYDFIENEDIQFFSNNFDKIMRGYGNHPVVNKYIITWKSDAHLFIGDYENSLRIRKEIGFHLRDLITFGFLKEDSLITGDVLVNLNSNGLTDFGERNKIKIAEILDVFLIDFKQLYGKNIVRHFLEDYNLSRLSQRDIDNLKKYFENEEEFQEILQYYAKSSEDYDQNLTIDNFDLKKLSQKDILRLKRNLKGNKKSNSGYIPGIKRVIDKPIFSSVPNLVNVSEKAYPYLVYRSLENELKRIIRESENSYREEVGLPRVGEGWVSETELFYKIKEAFPKEKVINHGRPSWLGLQHLDIYFPEKNVAIEYQGLQHDQPVDFFGGKAAFIENQERDKRKKKLCEKNNCALIYVYPEYNFENVKKEIEKLILLS